jgi:hypothetical protein
LKCFCGLVRVSHYEMLASFVPLVYLNNLTLVAFLFCSSKGS